MPEISIMRHVVGVSEMVLSNQPGDIIITHALGSCIGITIYDPHACVGGLLHYQLPSSKNHNSAAQLNHAMYADTGIPMLFRKAYNMGAEKHRIIVKVAGGGKAVSGSDIFEIGRKNYVYMRKIFWKNNILISGEYVDSPNPVTMWLDLATGQTTIRVKGEEIDL